MPKPPSQTIMDHQSYQAIILSMQNELIRLNEENTHLARVVTQQKKLFAELAAYLRSETDHL